MDVVAAAFLVAEGKDQEDEADLPRQLGAVEMLSSARGLVHLLAVLVREVDRRELDNR
jgi:hypothetical protein